MGLTIHVVHEVEGAPVRDAVWAQGQVDHANRLFEPVDVGFYIAAEHPLPASNAHVDTRAQRDAFRTKYTRGTVHVFVVERLGNVDEAGEINGVHWRQRSRRARRWIILSSIAWPLTLAHELGHFFGLPHSEYVESLMNKAPRPEPEPMERTFHVREVRRMRARLKRLIGSRELTVTKPNLP